MNVNRAYTTNGQNRYATIAGSTQSYDAKGNLSGSFGATYSYDAENELASGNGYTFYHDAIGRLSYVTSTGLFGYDGAMQVEQASASGAITRRYVFGPGTDEPIVWYEGSGTSDKRYLDADERGSITRITRQDGSTLAINTYDEYGIPGSGNQGRFQYTGQTWLSEVGFYDDKARVYSTTMGRFMQPDPIAEQGGVNFYNYVGGDPINRTDSSGLIAGADDVVITATIAHVAPAIIAGAGAAIASFGHAIGHVFHSILGGHHPKPPSSSGSGNSTTPAPQNLARSAVGDYDYWQASGCQLCNAWGVGNPYSGEYTIIGARYSDLYIPLIIGGIGVGAFAVPELLTAGAVAEGTVATSEMALTDLTATHGATLSRSAFRELSADISTNGIREPLSIVRNPAGNFIVDGNHRFIIANSLGLTRVPVQEVTLPFRGYKTETDLFNFGN